MSISPSCLKATYSCKGFWFHNLPSQFMVSMPISPCRKRVAVGSRPLSHGCLRQAGSLQAGCGRQVRVRKGLGACQHCQRVVCHRWLPAPTIGRKLSLVSSSKSQAVTSATSPVCPWVWPCQRSPPCCLETHGSLGAFGVGATGSPDGRFPRREGSSTPLLRFPLTGACCLPSAQGLGEAHLPPWFQVSRVPCPHLQERMLPCEPGWGSPGSREAQRGPEPCDLGPATHPCLPGHRGD